MKKRMDKAKNAAPRTDRAWFERRVAGPEAESDKLPEDQTDIESPLGHGIFARACRNEGLVPQTEQIVLAHQTTFIFPPFWLLCSSAQSPAAGLHRFSKWAGFHAQQTL